MFPFRRKKQTSKNVADTTFELLLIYALLFLVLQINDLINAKKLETEEHSISAKDENEIMS